MPGYEDLCGKITAGSTNCGAPPSTPGVEDTLYIANRGDLIITLNPANPFVITGITLAAGASLYKIVSNGDSFDTIDKPIKKQVGPRFEQTVMCNARHSVATKQLIVNGLAGKFHIIALNNDKNSDAAIELFGFDNGLQLTEDSQRQASNEDLQGSWAMTFKNPNRQLEGLPARAVAIAPEGGGSATYASTLAALEELAEA